MQAEREIELAARKVKVEDVADPHGGALAHVGQRCEFLAKLLEHDLIDVGGDEPVAALKGRKREAPGPRAQIENPRTSGALNEPVDDRGPCLRSLSRQRAPGLIPGRHVLVIDNPGRESS